MSVFLIRYLVFLFICINSIYNYFYSQTFTLVMRTGWGGYIAKQIITIANYSKCVSRFRFKKQHFNIYILYYSGQQQ